MMLKRLVNVLTPDFPTLTNRRVFIWLAVVSTLIRLPFFFRDYIDRDESTFILMGQSWVDGHLPYTELWDLKPPLTFLFFAGIIYVFGKSFLAIRFLGALLVATSAYFTYKITETTASKKIGFWAALGAVALQSMFGSIQGVMSEHLCMAFLMPALYILIKSKKATGHLIAGLLMGMAVMTKLNIAYAVLFVGLYQGYTYYLRRQYAKGMINLSLYGLGILFIFLLTLFPYFWVGKTEIWWKSVVLASLEYAGARRSPIFNIAPSFLILAAFFFFTWKKKYLDYKEVKIQMISVAIIGVLISFAKAGRINSHYLIQLYPLLIILVAIALSKLARFQKWDYRPYVFILVMMLPIESYLEYFRIAKNKIERGTYYNGEGITVPEYIKKNRPLEKNVLFLEYHIGYWPLGAKPPTKAATHPSNICRNELFPFFDNPRKTGVEELSYIMEVVRPKIVVTRKNRLIFDEKLEMENAYIDKYLKTHYKPMATVDQAGLYERLE